MANFLGFWIGIKILYIYFLISSMQNEEGVLDEEDDEDGCPYGRDLYPVQ